MWRLPRPTLVFWFIFGKIICVMELFMISKVFYLAQVSIALLSIFCDNNDIDTSSCNIKRLVLLISLWMRALFLELTQDLAELTGLASLTTTTTILINSKDVGSFFNFRLFLVFGLSYCWLIVMKVVSITHSNQKRPSNSSWPWHW